MMLAIPVEELASLTAILLAGGVLTGLLAGLLGIGGGAIIVPILYYLFELSGVPEEVRMHLCVGTSLAIIIPTSIRSYVSHRRRGAVDKAALRTWILPVVFGVAFGTLLAAVASSVGLQLVFGAFGILLGLQLLVFGTKNINLKEDLPGRKVMSVYGFGIGLFSALIGIGGGSLVALLFTIHGRSIHQGVATGAGIGVLISIPGAIGFMVAGLDQMDQLPPLSLGYVSILGAALIAPVSMLVAPIGVRFAHAFTRRQLESALGLFLLAMGAQFLISGMELIVGREAD